MYKQRVYIDFITPQAGLTYKLEGYLGGSSISSLAQIKVVVGKKVYSITPTHRIKHQEGLERDSPIADSTFEVLIKLPADAVRLRFQGKQGDLQIKTNRFTGLSRLMFSAKLIGDHVFTNSGGHLAARPYSKSRAVLNEVLILGSIFLNWRIIDAVQKVRLSIDKSGTYPIMEVIKMPLIVLQAIVYIPLSIGLRFIYYITKRKFTKPIWLISDRLGVAGDNGEAFFRYVMKNDISRDVRFVISKKSVDYERLASVGPVVPEGSWRHKLLFLHASSVISSHANPETTNPFHRQLNHFVDLFNFNFVFLQHGIIRHDLSDRFNRFNCNIDLFITSSEIEYQSVLKNYYYSEDNVILSGLPRYDLLNSRPKRKIIVMPTYRTSLLRPKLNREGRHSYDRKFKESDYFNFYNDFINEGHLIDIMKKYNMTGELYIHPMLSAQLRDFQGNDLFKVMEYPYDYQKAFSEGSLLVTDYSSVVFDFAYLKKPVLYAQFDVDMFFEGQSYRKLDSFSDEKDGFGDVCYDYDTLVKKTVQMVESKCIIGSKYRKRIDAYFYKTDKNNCERVYQALIAKGR